MADFLAGPVSSVSVSPDGKLVVAATAEGSLALGPLERPEAGGTPFTRLTSASQASVSCPPISALCFPGQDTVYTATTSGSFARYRLNGCESAPKRAYEIPDAHGSSGELTGIAAVSPSSVVVTCGKDALIRCWDPETHDSIARLSGHKYDVRAVSVATSSEGEGGEVVNIVASAGRDKTVRLWDVRASDSSAIHVFSGHSGWVHDVAISGGGAKRAAPVVVSCAGDKTVRLWNLKMMKQEAVFRGHDYRVWCVSVASDATYALSGSTDATVRAWNLAEGAAESDNSVVFDGHGDSVISLAVARSGNVGVSGSEDGSVFVWDTSTLFGRSPVDESAAEVLVGTGEAVKSGAADGNVGSSVPASGHVAGAGVDVGADSSLTAAAKPVDEPLIDFGDEKESHPSLDVNASQPTSDVLAAFATLSPVLDQAEQDNFFTSFKESDSTSVLTSGVLSEPAESEFPPASSESVTPVPVFVPPERAGAGRSPLSASAEPEPLAKSESVLISAADEVQGSQPVNEVAGGYVEDAKSSPGASGSEKHSPAPVSQSSAAIHGLDNSSVSKRPPSAAQKQEQFASPASITAASAVPKTPESNRSVKVSVLSSEVSPTTASLGGPAIVDAATKESESRLESSVRENSVKDAEIKLLHRRLQAAEKLAMDANARAVASAAVASAPSTPPSEVLGNRKKETAGETDSAAPKSRGAAFGKINERLLRMSQRLDAMLAAVDV